MIPTISYYSPSGRRGSLITQVDFEDILNVEKQEYLRQGSRFDGGPLQGFPSITMENGGIESFGDFQFNWPRRSVNMFSPRREEYPRSPFLPNISEIENMNLLSPVFSISSNSNSPVIKTPSTLYELCCSTRKPSDDLSIYLPDNFTPVSLESLDKCVNRTVFQFPPTASGINSDNSNKSSPSECFRFSPSTSRTSHENASSCSTNINNRSAEGYTDNFIQKTANLDIKPLDDMASVQEKRAKQKKRKKQTKNGLSKRRKSDINLDNLSLTDPSPSLRNKMERERRSDIKNRFQKLRDSMPAHVARDNVSKISILRVATKYVDQLVMTERELHEISLNEKSRNKELLKKLMNISRAINNNIDN